MSARDRILGRIRDALRTSGHPLEAFRSAGGGGGAPAARPSAVPPELQGDAPALFRRQFTRAGGEVEWFPDTRAAGDWLRQWVDGVVSPDAAVAFGRAAPAWAREALAHIPEAHAREATLGISAAVGAVAETGSLLLSATDGRAVQLLPPTHLVVVDAATLHLTLAEALAALRANLPSAVALHSGPSKSADIGQVVVQGVHGPGRVVAVVVG